MNNFLSILLLNSSVALDDEHMESIQVPASQNADLGKLFGKIIKQKVCENLLDKLAAEAEEESEEEEEVDDDGDYIMSQPDGCTSIFFHYYQRFFHLMS